MRHSKTGCHVNQHTARTQPEPKAYSLCIIIENRFDHQAESMSEEALNYCYGCMEQLPPGKALCPHCGYDNAVRHNATNLLSEGTILNGKYLLGKVIGRGGFGVTYLGIELILHIKVAIKEYFPNGISSRDISTRQVLSTTQGTNTDTFQRGMEAFQREAETLAKFNSPSIVHVREFFLENNTAYIVMDHIDGNGLNDEIRKNGGRIPWQRVKELMLPMMKELDKLHRKNLIHRDIKPDNIKIVRDRENGGDRLILLDFGSARNIFSTELTKTYTRVLTPGYAPFEQYQTRTHLGPFTDVYALCATMYACITGQRPPAAPDRMMKEDPLQPFSSFGLEIPKKMEKAIRHGLALNYKDRLQTMEELYKELTEEPEESEGKSEQRPGNLRTDFEAVTLADPDRMVSGETGENEAVKKPKLILYIILAVLLAAGIFLLSKLPESRKISETNALDTETVSVQSVPSQTPKAAETETSPAIPTSTTAAITPTQIQTAKAETAVPSNTPHSGESAEVITFPEPIPLPLFDLQHVQTGDVFTFGRFEQDETAGPDPIVWQVLTVESGKALLISRYGLETRAYDNEAAGQEVVFQAPAWKTSGLRSWLNNEFYKEAFSADEQQLIIEVKNSNTQLNIYEDYDTLDRIFLLSGDEVQDYFHDISSRQCKATDHAKQNGAYVSRSSGNSRWWLRTAESDRRFSGSTIYHSGQAFVSYDGNISYDGISAADTGTVVRPSLWLNLSQENSESQFSDVLPFSPPPSFHLTITPTATETPTFTPTLTETPTFTPTVTQTPTFTPTAADIPDPSFDPVAVIAGQTINFGQYEQDEESGADPIEWQVLAVENDRALLVSKYGLDAKAYHKSFTEVTWETSDLRAWLNGTFYETVFDEAEKSLILESFNQNPDNQDFETTGGNPTLDKIFLLSIDEVNQYLPDQAERKCSPTFYAEQNGAYVNKSNGKTIWWLRSPGILSDNAAIVDGFGAVYSSGAHTDNTICTIRPAFWLKL